MFKRWLENKEFGFSNYEIKNAFNLIKSEIDYAKQKIERGDNVDGVMSELTERIKDHLLAADFMK